MMQICSIMNSLIQNVQNTETFSTFNKSADAVNLFLGEFLHKNQKYISFWRVCGIVVFSHGQSAIERGFSNNKQFLYENLRKKNPYLISQQIVYDHINPKEISQKQ